MVGLALMGSVGCAGDVDGDGETDVSEKLALTLGSEAKIFGGETDDDPNAVSGVVAMKVGVRGSFELCSGALVAPNVVLTARHCVANSVTTTVTCDERGRSTNGAHVAGDLPASAVAIYTGPAPKYGASPKAVGAAIVAPETNTLCDRDIALIVLDRAITDVKPIAVRLGATVTPGETIRSVGYGQNDRAIPLGTRLRKAGVPVLATGSGVSASHTALGPHEFEVGRSICQGDSGGPAISEDTGAVVGVVSRGGHCQEDFGHIYTTTAGAEELFARAFALAGGAPILEPVSAAPRAHRFDAELLRSPLAERSVTSEGCSTSRGPARSFGGAAGLGLIAACALARRRRLRA